MLPCVYHESYVLCNEIVCVDGNRGAVHCAEKAAMLIPSTSGVVIHDDSTPVRAAFQGNMRLASFDYHLLSGMPWLHNV